MTERDRATSEYQSIEVKPTKGRNVLFFALVSPVLVVLLLTSIHCVFPNVNPWLLKLVSDICPGSCCEIFFTTPINTNSSELIPLQRLSSFLFYAMLWALITSTVILKMMVLWKGGDKSAADDQPQSRWRLSSLIRQYPLHFVLRSNVGLPQIISSEPLFGVPSSAAQFKYVVMAYQILFIVITIICFYWIMNIDSVIYYAYQTLFREGKKIFSGGVDNILGIYALYLGVGFPVLITIDILFYLMVGAWQRLHSLRTFGIRQ